MKSCFKFILITTIIYSQLSVVLASNPNNDGLIKIQETPGVTKVLSFPISELKLHHENKELYGIYPRRHFIDIFYKDHILARKGNDTYNSDFLENIIKKFDQLGSVPNSRVVFIFGKRSSKATTLHGKPVPTIKKILFIENVEDNEELIE